MMQHSQTKARARMAAALTSAAPAAASLLIAIVAACFPVQANAASAEGPGPLKGLWIPLAKACVYVGSPGVAASAPAGFPAVNGDVDGPESWMKVLATDDSVLVKKNADGGGLEVGFFHNYGGEQKMMIGTSFLQREPDELGRLFCYDMSYIDNRDTCKNGGVRISVQEIFVLPEGGRPEEHLDANGAPKKKRESILLPCYEYIEKATTETHTTGAPAPVTDGRVPPEK